VKEPSPSVRLVPLPKLADMPILDETFEVNLSGSSGPEIFDATGIGTIVNDDSSRVPVTVTGRLSGGYATLGAFRVYHRSSRVK